jgi:diguanylate cyclase (GGDEF)-like protein
MTAPRRDLLLAAALVGFLVAAVWAGAMVSSRTVDHLLRNDAEAEGEAWARYLAASVTDLDRIVAGEAPTPESMSFFERAQKVGNVFLYKIFDRNGGLRLASNELEKVGSSSASLPVHNPHAAEVVLRGEIEVEAEEGTPPNRPAYYSEAYVPVVKDGKIVGIVEVYVDQSAKRAAFRSEVAGAALALGAIIAAAFGLPALGFYWRTREKRQADTRADFLANHDSLTSLLNRSRFMHDLDQALALRCEVALHYIDINRVREINDTLGQAAGDEILRQAARRLQTLSDKRDLLARLGGDEFALAHVVREPREVSQRAQQILRALAETVQIGDRDIDTSANVGSAVSPVHGKGAAALLKSADIALTHAKGEGPGLRSLFRQEMDAELRARRELETELRRAVANDGFELHFQPIRRSEDERLTGFEALLRLPQKDGGQISPAVFIPLAERLGLISGIGDWVIRRACAIAATWPNGMTVAVNMSPVQFRDGTLVGKVKAALTESGLAADRLDLEITEGLLLSDVDSVMRQLADLRAIGVRIAMDDFGTGYSSLSYLWKFPFDKLKIDQSFTRALGGHDDAHLSSVIRAIVALGRSLGMTITAEGVETAEQAEFLKRVGCDELQGFHLGRPKPLENLPAEILRDFESRHRLPEMPVAEELPPLRSVTRTAS